MQTRNQTASTKDDFLDYSLLNTPLISIRPQLTDLSRDLKDLQTKERIGFDEIEIIMRALEIYSF